MAGDISSQGYLTAGQQKLEALRLQFIRFLRCKERDLMNRMTAADSASSAAAAEYNDWLGGSE